MSDTDRRAERREAFRQSLADEWLAGKRGATQAEAEMHADAMLAALDQAATVAEMYPVPAPAIPAAEPAPLDTGRWVEQEDGEWMIPGHGIRPWLTNGGHLSMSDGDQLTPDDVLAAARIIKRERRS